MDVEYCCAIIVRQDGVRGRGGEEMARGSAPIRAVGRAQRTFLRY